MSFSENRHPLFRDMLQANPDLVESGCALDFYFVACPFSENRHPLFRDMLQANLLGFDTRRLIQIAVGAAKGRDSDRSVTPATDRFRHANVFRFSKPRTMPMPRFR
jgi:hypothetical protein